MAFTKKAYTSFNSLNPDHKNFQSQAVENFKKYFDFHQFSERAFYDVKKTMTHEELQEVQALFKEVFFLNFSYKAKDLFNRMVKKPDYHVKAVKEKFTVVAILGTQDGQTSSIDYYVAPAAGGRWGVIDLSVEGVLLSRNYRGAFNRIYREQGLSGLKQKLSSKKDKLEQNYTE